MVEYQSNLYCGKPKFLCLRLRYEEIHENFVPKRIITVREGEDTQHRKRWEKCK